MCLDLGYGQIEISVNQMAASSSTILTIFVIKQKKPTYFQSDHLLNMRMKKMIRTKQGQMSTGGNEFVSYG